MVEQRMVFKVPHDVLVVFDYYEDCDEDPRTGGFCIDEVPFDDVKRMLDAQNEGRLFEDGDDSHINMLLIFAFATMVTAYNGQEIDTRSIQTYITSFGEYPNEGVPHFGVEEVLWWAANRLGSE